LLLLLLLLGETCHYLVKQRRATAAKTANTSKATTAANGIGAGVNFVVIEVRIELLLEYEILLPILLLDGGQGVDVLLEALSGRLFLCRVSEPSSEVLDQLMVGHSAISGQHVLSHGLQSEFRGPRHGKRIDRRYNTYGSNHQSFFLFRLDLIRSQKILS